MPASTAGSTARSAPLNGKIDRKTDALNVRIDALKDSLTSAKICALVLYIALAGSLYATLARGFGWIQLSRSGLRAIAERRLEPPEAHPLLL